MRTLISSGQGKRLISGRVNFVECRIHKQGNDIIRKFSPFDYGTFREQPKKFS